MLYNFNFGSNYLVGLLLFFGLLTYTEGLYKQEEYYLLKYEW